MSCSSWGPGVSGQSLVVISMTPTAPIVLPGTFVKQVIPFSGASAAGLIDVFKGTDLAPLLSSNGILVNTTGVYEIRPGYNLNPGSAGATVYGWVNINSVTNIIPQHEFSITEASSVGFYSQFQPLPGFYAQLTAGQIIGLSGAQDIGAGAGIVGRCSLSIFGPLIAP